jgi:hypothetical protein
MAEFKGAGVSDQKDRLCLQVHILANVAFISGYCGSARNVRFTPESGHVQCS